MALKGSNLCLFSTSTTILIIATAVLAAVLQSTLCNATLLIPDSELVLQNLKQTRNAVIHEWEPQNPHSVLTHPQHEDSQSERAGVDPLETGKKKPWQPFEHADKTGSSAYSGKETQSGQTTTVELKEREGELVKIGQRRARKTTRILDGVGGGRELVYITGDDAEAEERQQRDGDSYSTFVLIILAFFPGLTGIIVCGTLVVAVFAKASKPGSPEQKARKKINQLGIFDGVGTERKIPEIKGDRGRLPSVGAAVVSKRRLSTAEADRCYLERDIESGLCWGSSPRQPVPQNTRASPPRRGKIGRNAAKIGGGQERFLRRNKAAKTVNRSNHKATAKKANRLKPFVRTNK